MNRFIEKHGEWLYRGVVLLFLAAMVFLRSEFATKQDLDAAVTEIKRSSAELSRRVTVTDQTIAVMVEGNKVNERQDEQIKDHEKRLREVERLTR